DWWKKRHESKQQRRARLEQLARLLDESGNVYRSQRSQAQRLLDRIRVSQPSVIKTGDSFDQQFSRAFPALSAEEAQLHAIIRGVTQTAVKRANSEMATWLRNDDWFKQID